MQGSVHMSREQEDELEVYQFSLSNQLEGGRPLSIFSRARSKVRSCGSICGGQKEERGPTKAAQEPAPVLMETENILACQPKSSSEKGMDFWGRYLPASVICRPLLHS